MDKKFVLEVVGLSALVASLIFVGMEVRQAAVETRSSTVQELKHDWVDFNLAVATSPELADAWLLVWEQGRGVDARADRLFDGWARALLHAWSNAYYQYTHGILDDVQWRAYLRDIEDSGRYTVMHDFWRDWKHVYDDSFVEYIDQVFSGIERNSLIQAPGRSD